MDYKIHQFVQSIIYKHPELEKQLVCDYGTITLKAVPKNIAVQVLERFEKLKVTGVDLTVINSDNTIAFRSSK